MKLYFYITRLLTSLILLFAFSAVVMASDIPDSISGVEATPVQILGISQSSFSLVPSETKNGLVTLINLTEVEREVALHVVDAVDEELGIYEEIVDESMIQGYFDHPDVVKMKPHSIMQVPFEVTIPSESLKADLFGAVLLSSASEEAPHMDVRSVQPIDVAIDGLDANVLPNLMKLYSLLTLLLIFSAICTYLIYKWNRRFGVGAGILTFGAISFMLVNSIFMVDSGSMLQGNIFNATQDLGIVEDSSATLDAGEDDSLSYLEEHGEVVDGDAEFDVVDESVDFTEEEIQEDQLATIPVDVIVDIANPSTSNVSSERSGSPDVGASPDVSGSPDVGTDDNSYTYSEEYKVGYEWYDERYSGPEMAIMPGIHSEYQGIQLMLVNLFIDDFRVDSQVVKKYANKLLTLRDGGEVRNGVKQVCKVLKKNTRRKRTHGFDTLDLTNSSKKKFSKAVHALLKNEKEYDKQAVQSYLDEYLDDDLFVSRAEVVCDSLKEVYKVAEALEKRLTITDNNKVRLVKYFINKDADVQDIIQILDEIEVSDSFIANVEESEEGVDDIVKYVKRYYITYMKGEDTDGIAAEIAYNSNLIKESEEQEDEDIRRFEFFSEHEGNLIVGDEDDEHEGNNDGSNQIDDSDNGNDDGWVCEEDEPMIVEIKWGDIGKKLPRNIPHTYWDGWVKAKKGKISFGETVKFDKVDQIVAHDNKSIEWTSRIRSHFDGIRFEYMPNMKSDAARLKIKTDHTGQVIRLTPEEVIEGQLITFQGSYRLSVRQTGCGHIADDVVVEVDEEEDPVEIDLDLGESELVEITIPEIIHYDPLISSSTSYVANSTLGQFEMQTFDSAEEWDGYFSFEVVALPDGRELDLLWLEIDNKKIYPIEQIDERGTFIHFYVSDEDFPAIQQGLYQFSPNLEMWVPEYVMDGSFSADLYFTVIN